jgi:hypothetical protein
MYSPVILLFSGPVSHERISDLFCQPISHTAKELFGKKMNLF